MASFLKSIDAFDKYDNADLIRHSQSSKVCSSFITFFSTFFIMLQVIISLSPDIHRDLVTNSLLVNNEDIVNISINMIVSVPCLFLQLSNIDNIGHSEYHMNNTVRFIRINRNYGVIGLANETTNEPCHECIGLDMEGACCNYCDQLKYLYQSSGLDAKPDEWPQCKTDNGVNVSLDEMCHIKGKIPINRVKGNFFISVGRNTNLKPGHYYQYYVN